MKIILIKDIKGFGQKGEIKEASDGYARNFLIPRGWAKLADSFTVKQISQTLEENDLKQQKSQKQAEKIAKKLDGKTFELSLPVNKIGHLYAGLKKSDIFASIKKYMPGWPDSAEIPDYHPIKEAGIHMLLVHVAPNVKTRIKIAITSDANKPH